MPDTVPDIDWENLPGFMPPAFASVAEADAWMAEREHARDQMVQMAQLMTEYARTFRWWAAEDGTKVGYSTTRMSNGKFGWAVLDSESDYKTGLVVHGVCRLRKQAKAKAYAEFSRRSPKWTKKHDPNGDLLTRGEI